jgi:antitoxin component YwqK of YwqJK toxin-antitoxin module
MQGNINQRNKNGNRNGKWVVYHDNGELYHIKNYIDGVRVGYKQFHWRTGKITYHYYAR